jgi:hypothetical protein
MFAQAQKRISGHPTAHAGLTTHSQRGAPQRDTRTENAAGRSQASRQFFRWSHSFLPALSRPFSSHNRGKRQQQHTRTTESRAGLTQLFETLTAVQLQSPFKPSSNPFVGSASARVAISTPRVIACVKELQLPQESSRGKQKPYNVRNGDSIVCARVRHSTADCDSAAESQKMETFHPSLANRGEETDPRPAPSATPHNAGISCTIKPQNARLTIQLLPLVRSPFLTARACVHVPRFYRLWRLLDRDSAWLVYAHFIIIFWVVRVFSPVFFTTVPL